MLLRVVWTFFSSVLILPSLAEVAPASESAAPAGIDGLRTEMRQNPLGLHETRPRFSWQMQTARRGAAQEAFRILVASSPEFLAQGKGDLWDSGMVSLPQSHLVPYEGKPLTSRMRAWWTVEVSDETGTLHHPAKPAMFEMALLTPADWQADWICGPLEPVRGKALDLWFDHLQTGGKERGNEYWKNVKANIDAVTPAPIFRKTFEIAKLPDSARLYISGLGYHTAWINGRRVGDRHFDPVQTSYEFRIPYVVHDVSSYLVPGKNVIAVELSDGWFSSPVAKVGGEAYFERPVLRCQLEIEGDGKSRVIPSDGSWRYASGGLIASDLYIGEVYDARLENHDWREIGYDDSTWKEAVTVPGFKPRGLKPLQQAPGMFASARPPERVIRSAPAEWVKEVRKGVWVFRFPQRASATFTLNPSGLPEGCTIIMRTFEYLIGEGNRTIPPAIPRYFEDLPGTELREDGLRWGDVRGLGGGSQMVWLVRRGEKAGYVYQMKGWPTSVYVSDGKRTAPWTTGYSHQPFQVIEVLGIPEGWTPPADFLTMNVVHTDFKKSSRLTSSDGFLLQLEEICWNTFLFSNHGFPQDNPGAERGGFPQESTSVDAAYYSDPSGTALMMREWIADMMYKDEAIGTPPITAPGRRRLFSFKNPAQVYFPLLHVWRQFVISGDDAAMRDFFDRLSLRLDESWSRLDLTKGWNAVSWGDWGDVDTRMIGQTSGHFPRSGSGDPLNTSKGFTELARLHRAFEIAAEMADLLGNQAAALKSRERAGALREAIQKHYYNTGVGTFGSQTSDSVALKQGLVTGDEAARVPRALLADVDRHQGRFTGGSMEGLRHILDSLSAVSPERAYKAMTLPGFPGYRHMMETEPGSGTVWEMWDGSTRRPDAACGHRCIQVSTPLHGLAYLYGDLAGIQPDPEQPGLRHVFLRPAIPDSLESFSAEIDTPYGRLSTKWQHAAGKLDWQVTVPPNSSATLELPAWLNPRHDVREAGKALGGDPDVSILPAADGSFRIGLRAGTYHFTALKNP